MRSWWELDRKSALPKQPRMRMWCCSTLMILFSLLIIYFKTNTNLDPVFLRLGIQGQCTPSKNARKRGQLTQIYFVSKISLSCSISMLWIGPGTSSFLNTAAVISVHLTYWPQGCPLSCSRLAPLIGSVVEVLNSDNGMVTNNSFFLTENEHVNTWDLTPTLRGQVQVWGWEAMSSHQTPVELLLSHLYTP